VRSWLPTADAIRTIARAYAGDDVQTIMDFPAYRLTVKFHGTGLPHNLAALEAEIVRVFPARLGRVQWEIGCLNWGDLWEWSDEDEDNNTWGFLEDDDERQRNITWEMLETMPRQDLPHGEWVAGHAVPPEISDIQVSVTHNSATITWETDVAASAAVDFGLDDSYGNTVNAAPTRRYHQPQQTEA
jgi:hypothetical protein